MKYGQYLQENKIPEWHDKYLDYDALKSIIKILEDKVDSNPIDDSASIVAMTVPSQPDAMGMPKEGNLKTRDTQEAFFQKIEQEMKKIHDFMKEKVQNMRELLKEIETKTKADKKNISESDEEELRAKVKKAGDDFLKLEKYANVNFTAFNKILKKHDRRLPNPCKKFYMARLNEQSWVAGDHSDIIVKMSSIYSLLRGDADIKEEETAKQDFVRSTRKYWVKKEDILMVKYIVLQNLPVFLQKNTMSGECDSQLVNSIYLDNTIMELYQGRLLKTDGAIALRMRWYGTGTPETIFVERKTHRDRFTGELSVKERFTVKEEQVKHVLSGNFDAAAEIEKMVAKGKKPDDIQKWSTLVEEILQAISCKQLVPKMRTQYMRTAFQVPFDPTVRISLDTNLTMITEGVDESRWFRDPTKPIPLNEITRFPHAVLEIKLQGASPPWVEQLLESGMLIELHKFSKFIHGCAVLLTDEVRSMPYWIDDPTLRDSIIKSEGISALSSRPEDQADFHNQLIQHMKPPGKKKNPNRVRIQTGETIEELQNLRSAEDDDGQGADGENCTSYFCGPTGPSDEKCHAFWCDWAEAHHADRMTHQKIEPKLIFANERTLVNWLQNAVALSSIATGILAFSSSTSRSYIIALMLLPLSLMFIIYGLNQYLWRLDKILTRAPDRWDDPQGPIILTVVLVFALLCQFGIKVYDISHASPNSPNHVIIWTPDRNTTHPTMTPTMGPTWPTYSPSSLPTEFPTTAPSELPTLFPTFSPPTELPTAATTAFPTSESPSEYPTHKPTHKPSRLPTELPPTEYPSAQTIYVPSEISTVTPTTASDQTYAPSVVQTVATTEQPTNASPTEQPTNAPPTDFPTATVNTQNSSTGV